MPTLRLRRTLRHAPRERPRVRRPRVRGRVGGIGGAADFEVLAGGVVGLAVFGRAEGEGGRGAGTGGGFDGAGVGGGGEGPFLEEGDDGLGCVDVVLGDCVSDISTRSSSLVSTHVLRVGPCVRHVVDGVVCVDTLQIATAPLGLLDMAAVQGRIGRVFAVPVTHAPRSHEVRDVGQTAVAPGTAVVRDGVVFLAVELNDGHVLAAGVAVDHDGVGVAVLVRSALVVSARDTGERCDASGSHGVTGEDVGREAAAVALAGSVDLVGVDTVLVRDRVNHVKGEANVVGLSRRVALPLFVDTLRISHQHVLVVSRLRELGEGSLLS